MIADAAGIGNGIDGEIVPRRGLVLILRRMLSLQGKAQNEQVEYETWTAHDLYPCGATPEQELRSSAQPDERGEASRTGSAG